MKKILFIAFLALSLTTYGQRSKAGGTCNMTLSKDSVFLLFDNNDLVGAVGSIEIKCNDLTTDAYVYVGVGKDTAKQTWATGYDTLKLDRGKIVMQFPVQAPVTSGKMILGVKHGTETNAILETKYYFRRD